LSGNDAACYDFNGVTGLQNKAKLYFATLLRLSLLVTIVWYCSYEFRGGHFFLQEIYFLQKGHLFFFCFFFPDFQTALASSPPPCVPAHMSATATCAMLFEKEFGCGRAAPRNQCFAGGRLNTKAFSPAAPPAVFGGGATLAVCGGGGELGTACGGGDAGVVDVAVVGFSARLS
jgi:hypothetical protein